MQTQQRKIELFAFPLREPEFTLDPTFLKQFEDQQPDWGPVGYITYMRTYARLLPDGSTEEYWQTCKRVVEGVYRIQQRHCQLVHTPWRPDKAQRSAQTMYRLMWEFKWLPPGRGLWMMGTPFIETHGSACLQNCGFTSTEHIDTDFAEPFTFLMDMSMLGVGVGGDVRGAGKLTITEPDRTLGVTYHVPDTREGWVAAVAQCLRAYAGQDYMPSEWDYSLVRAAGEPINGFGGVAAGPEPLKQLIETDIPSVLDPLVGKPITKAAIVDVFNYIGKCVIAGNVRRSAEIMFGDDSDEFLDLKNPEVNAEALEDRRWASNNSVFASVGMDYTKAANRTALNGEPGYMWLDNVQAYGRMADPPTFADKRVRGGNPCLEQSLEPFELCVAGDTPIQSKTGVRQISDLVGEEVEVWNGDAWSKVTPRITGRDRELLRVELSDGSYLDCTENHGWHVRPEGKRVFRRVEAAKLQAGDRVAAYTIDQPIEGQHEPHAFEWGLFAGDGYIDAERPMVIVCGKKAKLQNLDVSGSWYSPQVKAGYTDPVNRLSLKGLIPLQVAAEINDKAHGIPRHIFELDRQSLLEFVAGWIEADGSITNVGTPAEGYRVYGAEAKMRNLQLILRRVGINHSTIRKFADEGEVTNFGQRNYALWYCQIPSFECAEIPTRLKCVTNIGNRYAKNNAYEHSAPIDRARKQRVVSVTRLPGRHTTYCFDEPENHMAVFGNALTYQCNLVETFPAHHDTYEEYQLTLKYAYLYAKSVTLVSTHNPRTNAVMMRNRRIGTSMSGIVQAFAKFGRREFFQWCDRGYRYLRALDEVYSEWMAVRRSVKITSVKPSGTVSKLVGSTCGVHYPPAEYYVQRIRFAVDSSLVEPLRVMGYPVEPCKYSPNTVVIEFPVHEKHFYKAEHDVSLWEQLANAVAMQRYWADNQVSCTVKFDRDTEGADIAAALELYEDQLKGISFLPHAHGYDQPPWEPITAEDYFARRLVIGQQAERVEELFEGDTHEVTERFCDSDSCQISW